VSGESEIFCRLGGGHMGIWRFTAEGKEGRKGRKKAFVADEEIGWDRSGFCSFFRFLIFVYEMVGLEEGMVTGVKGRALSVGWFLGCV